MKIILTGHTSPSGQILYAHLSKKYEVIGISRTTGYDLTNQDDMMKAVGQSAMADHFINLANVPTQADILYNTHLMWSRLGKEGNIISFGTLATEVPFKLLKKIPIDMDMLSHKMLLEKMHKELSFAQPFGNQPKSVLLRFANYGHKKDHRANEPFTSPQQLTTMIDFILDSDTYISALDFREI